MFKLLTQSPGPTAHNPLNIMHHLTFHEAAPRKQDSNLDIVREVLIPQIRAMVHRVLGPVETTGMYCGQDDAAYESRIDLEDEVIAIITHSWATIRVYAEGPESAVTRAIRATRDPLIGQMLPWASSR